MSEKSNWENSPISRRDFLTTAGGVTLAAAANVARGQPPARPGQKTNILIIIADQLAQRAVGCYGDRWAETPNINSLAASGVRFSNAYTNCPLCQPSRASFWTGRLPNQTGVTSNGMNYPVPDIPLKMPTLGEQFLIAGYETINFGKRHDAGSLRGFKLVETEELEVEHPEAWPVNYDSKQDAYTTGKCVEYLRQTHDKPFLAVASLNNPHNICGWVGENAGVHEDVPIPYGELPPLPGNFEIDDLESRPLPVQYLCCSHRRLEQACHWSETNYRHYLAAYYHYLKMVDTQIGQILEALHSTPAGNNTLVVFLSDHGDSMASHRMVTKQVSFYEETTRVPLIFAGAGLGGRGTLINRPLVSLLDLTPTLCDYAGIPAPRDLFGRSLMPWLRGKKPSSWHDYVVSEWLTEWGYTISPGRMIRTDNYKYTKYVEGGGEELYNLEEDPGEKINLAGYGHYAGELKEHREILKNHVRNTRDKFFGLGVRVDKRWRSHNPGYQNHQGLSAPEAAWEAEEKK